MGERGGCGLVPREMGGDALRLPIVMFGALFALTSVCADNAVRLTSAPGDAGMDLTTVDYNQAGSPPYLDIDVVMRLYGWMHAGS